MISQPVVRDRLSRYKYYIVIGALFSIAWQQIYYRFFRVPRNLRHIPSIAYAQQLLALLRGEPITLRTQRLVFPLLSKANGIYLNRAPFLWTTFVANPVLAKEVLFKSELANKNTILDAFPKDSAFVEFVGKDNVAFSNGEKWKRQRKIMNPIFHRATPAAAFASVTLKLFRVIDDTQAAGSHVAVPILMKRLALEALGRTMFGFDFGGLEDEGSEWVAACNEVFTSFSDFTSLSARADAMLRVFSRSRQEKYKARFRLINMFDDMIEQRRVTLLDTKETSSTNVPDNEKDLLTLLLEAEMRGEGTWRKNELRYNIATLFFAGHDTTASTLSFALYSLAVNKEVQSKAREEVNDLLGNNHNDVAPTLEQCKQLPYIDMIIKETLRMFSPSDHLFARVASDDLELGGVLIPKGAKVSVDFHALHYHPDLWEAPERFIPERFSDSGEHSKHEGITWAPFSGGSRQCIGLNFSMTEQRVALSMLLRKYEWELPAGSIHEKGLVMDQPYNFAPMSLELRFKKIY